jgi:hypothetical protein
VGSNAAESFLAAVCVAASMLLLRFREQRSDVAAAIGHRSELIFTIN